MTGTEATIFSLAERLRFDKNAQIELAPKWSARHIQKAIFGIERATADIRGSKLVHPNSPCALLVSATSMVLLIYTAVQTPIALGFYYNAPPCEKPPTLLFDAFLDGFFLFEIMFNFAVGIDVGGYYHDDFNAVACHYLKGNFAFDISTSIPVGIIEWQVLSFCDVSNSEGSPAKHLRFARVMKPLRLLKMARVLKATRIGEIIKYLESTFHVPSELLRIVVVLALLFYGAHVCACAFWLVKESTNSPQDIAEFLSEMNVKNTLAASYMVSLYFVVTVMTTVGFGDVSAVNSSEQGLIVFYMILGVIGFGVLLNELNIILEDVRRVSIIRDSAVGRARDFLRSRGASASMERSIIAFLEFDCIERDKYRRTKEFLDELPDMMRRHVVKLELTGKLDSLTWCHLESKHEEDFMVDLWDSFEQRIFCTGHILSHAGELCYELYLITSGRVSVVDVNKTSTVRAIRHEGHFLGEWSLLGDWQWVQGVPRDDSVVTCDTMTSTLVLTQDSFNQCIARYPEELREELEGKYCDHIDRIHTFGHSWKREKAESEAQACAAGLWGVLVAKLVERADSSSESAALNIFSPSLGLTCSSGVVTIMIGKPAGNPTPSPSEDPSAISNAMDPGMREREISGIPAVVSCDLFTGKECDAIGCHHSLENAPGTNHRRLGQQELSVQQSHQLSMQVANEDGSGGSNYNSKSNEIQVLWDHLEGLQSDVNHIKGGCDEMQSHITKILTLLEQGPLHVGHISLSPPSCPLFPAGEVSA